jgi:putative oxidoreductase
MKYLLQAQHLLDRAKTIDFLGPLALRIYLAPLFILAGYGKLAHIDDVAGWFDSLGLPAPYLMTYLAGLTEFLGGIALLLGLAVRWFALPMMFTMVVAASVHWDNGWHALPESELVVPWEWRKDLLAEAQTRRQKARALLQEHGNYDWLTETGSITILKNGIEFAATYFIMLLMLFFTGAGKYLSLDYWLARRFSPA